MLTSPRGWMRLSAFLISASALLSGPLAMLVVQWVAPQPRWTDVRTFILHYDAIQAVPYVLGFPLVLGFVLFTAACHATTEAANRVRTSAAMTLTAVYAALVFLNYVLQVAFVPRILVTDPSLAAALTMANPSSLAWLLEMFGYGALGVAMGLVSPLFGGSTSSNWIRVLLIANSLMSVAGAVLAGMFDGWVFSTGGLASFFAWNVVVIVGFGMIAAGSAAADPGAGEPQPTTP